MFLASNTIVLILFWEKLKRLSSKEKESWCKDFCSRHSDGELNSEEIICVEDSCDEGCEEGIQDDLEKKAQEFIDMMNAFWREELIHDRFL